MFMKFNIQVQFSAPIRFVFSFVSLMSASLQHILTDKRTFEMLIAIKASKGGQ